MQTVTVIGLMGKSFCANGVLLLIHLRVFFCAGLCLLCVRQGEGRGENEWRDTQRREDREREGKERDTER